MCAARQHAQGLLKKGIPVLKRGAASAAYLLRYFGDPGWP